MPASRNLAVNKNIKQFQRLMRSHAWCSKYRYRSSRSGPGFERVLADQRQAETLTSDFKAFPQMVYVRTDLRSRVYILFSKLVLDVKHDLLHYVMTATASTNNFCSFQCKCHKMYDFFFSLSTMQSENIFDLKCIDVLSLYWNFGISVNVSEASAACRSLFCLRIQCELRRSDLA